MPNDRDAGSTDVNGLPPSRVRLYASWRDRRRLRMRQVHRPGEKLFLDYSGKRPRICDHETGEVTEVELFVGGSRPVDLTNEVVPAYFFTNEHGCWEQEGSAGPCSGGVDLWRLHCRPQ
jgi:hypothetical protein